MYAGMQTYNIQQIYSQVCVPVYDPVYNLNHIIISTLCIMIGE